MRQISLQNPWFDIFDWERIMFHISTEDFPHQTTMRISTLFFLENSFGVNWIGVGMERENLEGLHQEKYSISENV